MPLTAHIICAYYMRMKHTHPAPKRRPVNLSLPEDTVAEAKQLGINASQAAEEGLRLAVKREKEKRWLEENREAIAAHTAWIEQHGVPLTPIWEMTDEAI